MADPTLSLQLFALGPPEARLGESLLTFPTRKTLALLIYLAIDQACSHANTWPPCCGRKQALSAAMPTCATPSATCKRLCAGRAGRPRPLTSPSQTSAGSNPDTHIDFDLRTIEGAYALARAERSSRTLPEGSASLPILQSAVSCQRGDFLTGFSLGDAPGFDDWAAIQREVWHRRLGLILDRLSEIQFASGEFAGAADTASRWIALDGLNEVAYRRKMRAHFAAGERGQALATYEACRAVLAAELGVEPEPDTAELAESIRTQASLYNPAVALNPGCTGQIHRLLFWEICLSGGTANTRCLLDSYERAQQASLSLSCCAAMLELVRPAWPGNLWTGPAPREPSYCIAAHLRAAAICRFNRWWRRSGCASKMVITPRICWMKNGCPR